MFLYNAKAHHRAAELSQIFNAEFPFEKIMDTSRDVLRDREQEFEALVSNNAVIVDGERYVHISDFAEGTVVKRKVNRCLEKMPSTVSRIEEKCPLHSKRCRLIRFYYGFLCFLHLLTEDSDPETVQLPSTAAPLEEEGVDEEIAIDPAEERELVLSSVLPSEKTTLSITPIEDDQNDEQGDLPLSCFPSFSMVDNHDFVLLTDIMHLFNIREDYCLAAISSYSEADMNWVVDDLDQHLLVDSAVKDSEYRSGKEILKGIFDEWSTCEAQLPSEEEHSAATNRLGLADMGKFHEPIVHEDSKSTVALWARSYLEDDENQKVLSC